MTLKSSAPLPEFSTHKSLTALFNAEAKKATEDFPELAGRFALVNVPEGEAVTFVDPMRTRLRSQRELDYILGDVAGAAAEAHSSLATKLPNGLNVLAYTPLPFRMFTGRDQSEDMETLAVIDHELGHLVVGGAFSSKDSCYRETAADAFAVLRHMQRYGDESRAIEKAGWRRAFDFVMTGDRGHFTTLALDELDAVKHKIDIKAMTPDQTMKLAQRIALEHTPHFDATDIIGASFSPVRMVMERSGSVEEGLKALAGIALASDNAFYTFKIGARVLKPFLNGEVLDGRTHQPIELKGDYWDKVRQDLAAKSAQLKDDGILFGMPLKGQPPKTSMADVIPFPRRQDPRFERFKQNLL